MTTQEHPLIDAFRQSILTDSRMLNATLAGNLVEFIVYE